jgi:hypothetical protein
MWTKQERGQQVLTEAPRAINRPIEPELKRIETRN